MQALTGILPPLPTAFRSNGSLYPEKMQENIRALSAFPLTGFLILGSNGELVMLSEKEKAATYHAAREAIAPDKLMLAGTGEESTRATIYLTKEAGKAGADAALVLNPAYYKGQMSSEALVGHYHAVADASTIPVIIYNMPSNTGLDMTAETILSISSHPNIIGLKDSGGNLAKMGAIIGQAKKGFRVLAGSAGFLLPALSTGASGGILALANIAPAYCCSIFEYFGQGAHDKARIIQHRIITANAAVTRQWGVPALKAAMDHLGLYGGPARKPLLPVSDKNRKQLVQILQDAGIDSFLK